MSKTTRRHADSRDADGEYSRPKAGEAKPRLMGRLSTRAFWDAVDPDREDAIYQPSAPIKR